MEKNKILAKIHKKIRHFYNFSPIILSGVILFVGIFDNKMIKKHFITVLRAPVYILIATESVIFSPKIVFILRREKICFRKTWLF